MCLVMYDRRSVCDDGLGYRVYDTFRKAGLGVRTACIHLSLARELPEHIEAGDKDTKFHYDSSLTRQRERRDP